MAQWSPAEAERCYRLLVRARHFDETLIRLIRDGRMSGFYHAGIGQEAVGVGAVMALTDSDYIMYDHRGMTQPLAKGVAMDRIFADFLNRAGGTTRGKGTGVVHVSDPELGVLGQSGTLGGCFPIAIGAGYSAKLRKSGQVTVCFFGDGTSNRGTFHESLNMAALWRLPVVFVCQNNGWAVSNPTERSTSARSIADRAYGYGIPGVVVDGFDPRAVNAAVAEAVDRARAGEGPTLIECKVVRFRGHYEGDAQPYRTAEELAALQALDPLPRFRREVLAEGLLTEAALDAIELTERAAVEAALASADQFPEVTRADVMAGLFCEEVNG